MIVDDERLIRRDAQAAVSFGSQRQLTVPVAAVHQATQIVTDADRVADAVYHGTR